MNPSRREMGIILLVLAALSESAYAASGADRTAKENLHILLYVIGGMIAIGALCCLYSKAKKGCRTEVYHHHYYSVHRQSDLAVPLVLGDEAAGRAVIGPQNHA